MQRGFFSLLFDFSFGLVRCGLFQSYLLLHLRLIFVCADDEECDVMLIPVVIFFHVELGVEVYGFQFDRKLGGD